MTAASLRAAEIEQARAALADGVGVLVIGEHGTGRSHVVASALSQLDAPARDRVWVGDDIERLDPAGAARLAEAVGAGRVVPILAALGDDSLSAELSRAMKYRSAVRIPLGTLSAAQLLRWTEQRLEAPLHPDSVAGIIPQRGGRDIVLLGESLEIARTTGGIALIDGAWRAAAAPRPEPALRALALSRSPVTAPAAEDSPTAVGELIELIALAPELTLDVVDDVARRLSLGAEVPAILEQLEEAGTIEVLDTATQPRIRLRDGILELTMTGSTGILRQRRIIQAVVDVLNGLPASRLSARDTITLARFSLELGDRPDAVLVARAAVASFRDPDLELTRRLAAAAVELAGGFDAEMVLAATESQLGHSDLALARLEQLVARAQDDLERSRSLSALLAQVRERASRPAWALDVHQVAVSSGLVDPEALPQAAASRGLMLQALGDTVGAAQLLEPALADLEGPALLQAHLAVSHEAMFRGAFTRAHAALDAGRALYEASGQDSSSLEIDRALLLSFEGRIADSLAIVRPFREAAEAFGQWVPQALCTWGIGGLLLTIGRAAEAAAELRSAITLMEHVGATRSALMVRTDLARALSVQGDPAAARIALEPAMEPSALVYLDARAQQALGWIDAAEGRLEDAASEFLRAAGTYRASEADIPELGALSEAARAGAAPAVLERVEVIAASAEGEFVAFCARHARALAALQAGGGDADLAREFSDIGGQAAGLELHLVSAEAFVAASAIATALGDERAAAAADRQAAEHLAVCGLERSPLQSAPVTGSSLSAREIEIASRAVAGLSNREIAAELVLSVRTVETHLQRIYRKTGVRGRSELSDALGNLRRAL